MSRRTLLLLFILLSVAVAAQKVPIRDVARHSSEITTLMAPGSVPFHLKVSISSVSARGEIEAYWMSSTKWRRTIRTPEFSQTTIVNGEAYYEKEDGAYFASSLRSQQPFFSPYQAVCDKPSANLR
jgi:hypothetical protein